MTITEPVIGDVSAVSGVQLEVALLGDAVGGQAGHADRLPLSVGSLVKMRTRRSTVFANLTDLTRLRGTAGGDAAVGYVASADLIGEVADATEQFQRGVSEYPAIGAEVHRANLQDVTNIYDCGDASKVRIGRLLRQGGDIAAHVMIDPLLSRHFAVLGSTGTGKSTAVALLLRAILEANRSGHVVLLDPHNEYHDALSDLAEVIDLTSLKMPCWMLNFEEMGAIMVPAGEAQEREMQLSILKEAIIEAKLNYAGPGKDTTYITVDTPVPYRIGDISKLIERAMARPNRPIGVGSFLSLIERFNHLERDRRYEFLFAGFQIRDELPGLMARILKIPSEGKPMTILDLSGVPSEIVDVVVSLLCRIIFDFALWSDHRRSSPLLLVCEEAHRYVPERIEVGFAATRRSIERIAKEGRKYGVGLGLISQRPSEVDTSILSQCGTLFAFRLSNDRDQSYVAAALPEYAHGLVAELPSLRRQEAVVVGEGVPLSMRMRFDDVPETHRPSVVSTSFSEAWQKGNLDQRFIDETIDHWRTQRRHH